MGGGGLTADALFPVASSVAQELILEVVEVRTTGTSDYLSASTLEMVRRPAVNDLLLHLLVRSTR